MKHEGAGNRITGLGSLVLFAVFALCVLSVLLTGAKVYQSLTQSQEQSHAAHTAAQYIATRIRQGDQLAGVAVEDFQGRDALVFSDKVGGAVYETKIYCHEGWLWELFAQEGANLAPEDGQKLCQAQALEADPPAAGQVTVRLQTPDGQWQTLSFYLHSGEAVGL